MEAVKSEREPAPGRRGLQERPERPMKLPVRQSEHLRPPLEAARCEREPAPERRGLKKITLRWQGTACRAGRSLEEPLRWRRKEAPRAWVAKEGVAGTVTLGSFNKLATRRTPADLSS